MVSMVDVATMLANIAKHGRLMRASLGYLRLQAEDHGPRLARVGGDLVPVRQLLQGAADATAELHLLAAEAGLLEGRLAELPGAGGRGGAGGGAGRRRNSLHGVRPLQAGLVVNRLH